MKFRCSAHSRVTFLGRSRGVLGTYVLIIIILIFLKMSREMRGIFWTLIFFPHFEVQNYAYTDICLKMSKQIWHLHINQTT